MLAAKRAACQSRNLMDIHPQIWIFGGSLVAILLLFLVAVWLRLGGSPVISSDADARRLADEVWSGFEPRKISIDEQGEAALLDDPDGRIMLLKRHGNRFAGRILLGSALAINDGSTLEVFSGEARFGTVTLTLADAPAWAEAINRLKGRSDA